MDFQDKTLTCRDCSKEFVWTAGEQQFYADKGLQNPPSRCKECRETARQAKANRPTFPITCKGCGKPDEVTFEPRDPKDVLCKECFMKKRATESGAEAGKTEETV